ncbi:hypothetical protein OEZ86_000973 [Tetradesmus obliquus]|nr:hypothetical protein OEZ86_000973 [Tetradesmus obliquus]
MQQPRDVDSTEHESEGYDDYDEANFEELYTSCEDAAGALRCFWAQPAHAKLLAKPLPFRYNAEQLIVMYLGAQQVMNLQVAVLEAEQTCSGMHAQGLVGPSEQALLQATFTHQPVVPLARLLVWLQQRPDLLQLHKLKADISSTAANSSDTPLQPYAALWYRSAMGLSRLLQLAVTWHERSGCGIDVLQQIQQQLTKYGLPEQLPKFLQQLVGLLQAQQQPLKGIPISTAMNLAAYMMQLLLQRDCVTVQDISWRWAEGMLQQMVQCAQAAGLMRILVSRAALTGSSSNSSRSSSSSSSSSVAGLGSGSSSGVDDTAQAMSDRDFGLQQQRQAKSAVTAAAQLALFFAGEGDDTACSTRRALFVCQLARKHPVPFFQFLDTCARSGGLEGPDIMRLCTLAVTGSTRIGSRGLLDLLSSPAATAALASALASILKLCMQQLHRCGAAAAAAGEAGEQQQQQQQQLQQACALVVPAAGEAQDAPREQAGALKQPLLLLIPLSSSLRQLALDRLKRGADLLDSNTHGGSSSSSSSSSSSGTSEQLGPSIMLLLVLICRGLVALHEAAQHLPVFAACQAAGWRSHKKACRRMQHYGLSVQG